jgi:hypothetical protein
MTHHATALRSPQTSVVWRRLGLLGLLTLAFFALAAANPAWADPPGRVGRIAELSGNVWLYDDEQAEWIQARRNRPVTEGDRLSAERGARVEVQVGSATLRLDGGSEAEFAQLDDDRVHVRLHGGTLALRARGGRDVEITRDIAILVPEGRFEPLRGGRYRIDVSEQRSSLGAVMQGAMRFESRDSQLDIAAGQRAEFWVERGQTHYAWASPTNDRFDDWVARDDRQDDRDRERHVAPEMTGGEDLDRHGVWDRHPEYGALWYPRYVSPSWAPYRYGHWVHLRAWGWTWVDDAPWGFAPFHYGRWVHWNGRWGWCPGQYVSRPVFAPALVAWFGSGNVRVGVNIGGPTVGWVPLAPREVYYPAYHVTNVYVRNVNSPYQRWHGSQPRYERDAPSRPIMYTNQGVAGGVTVVPQGVMRGRQPITSQVAVPVDARTVAQWQPQPAQAVLPAAPRVVAAAPQAVVPAAPGAQRVAPWTPPGQARRRDDDHPPARERNAARGDDGDGHHRPGRGAEIRPGMSVGRPAPPQAQAQVQSPVAPVAPGVQPIPPVTPTVKPAPGQAVRPPQMGAPAAPQGQPQGQQVRRGDRDDNDGPRQGERGRRGGENARDQQHR